MTSFERTIRYHNRITDGALHHAYGRVASNASSKANFHELLHCARNRAPRLLDAPVADGHQHPGVEALLNLARLSAVHIRSTADWSGTTKSWRPAIASLAHHLVGHYKVPAFLAASWWSNQPCADRMRGWFIAHSRGASFRSLNLPIVMTKKMEHIFLASPDHLAIERALRRAELLAWGVPSEFVQAVLSTRLAADFSNGLFWRTFWSFLVANATFLDPSHIGPMIDFIQAVRHETANGIVSMDPPRPAFSLTGRTLQSMLRLMQDWHRTIGLGDGSFRWAPSPLKPMLMEELRDTDSISQENSAPPKVWRFMEITDSAQLRAEGKALHHCVASYAGRCCQGVSRIWSLRVEQGDKMRRVLTIEIDLKRRAVVQARGWANRPAAGKSLRLLQDWSLRELEP